MAEERTVVLPSLEIEGRPFRVLSYLLEEAVSEQSALFCEAVEVDVEPPDPAAVIGKEAVFNLTRSDGSGDRTFLGRIVLAERAPSDDDVRTLRLRIVPAPWALSKRADSRTFQEKSVVDIVTEVLEAGGVPSDQQSWQTTDTYSPMPYTVQYRETDFDFVRRLLSEAGIYFAVHFIDGKDVMVFGDDPTGLGDIEAPTTLSFVDEFGNVEARDMVMRVTQSHAVTPDKVMLRDYNAEKPSLEIEGTVESDDEGSHVLEIYDYPARCREPADAERLATVLLDEVQAPRSLVRGESGALTLLPGLRITIEDHPYAPINQEYLVTSVRIEGATARRGHHAEKYSCTFEGMPTKHRYRPPRKRRAADMVGLQTAFTTGPDGKEIYTSGAGEVTVRYPWDRLGKTDDTSSPFVRTSQVPTGGSVMLPRTKWEVSTVHLEGDPDRPVVMGRMYNGTTRPPYNLPDECASSSIQTATTPGGGSTNELRMGDSAGSEELFFNASKDMTVDVKNNATTNVGNDCSREIGSNHTKNITNSLTATIGANQTLTVGGNQNVSVETLMQDEVAGDHSLDIGGNRDMKVGGDHKRDVGGDSTLDIGGRMLDLVVGSTTDDTLGDYHHEVSAALVDIVATDRSLQVGGNTTETAGAAKVVAVGGGRGVEIGGNLTQKVAGAIINLADGDRVETSGGMFSEIAAGAHIVKAKNISIEADTMLSIVMGASTLILLPAVATVLGLKLKLDGDVVDDSILVVDN